MPEGARFCQRVFVAFAFHHVKGTTVKNKVDAVYELREAAEEHGRAEERLQRERSPKSVDALLDAKERLEVKTVEAIQACEHCGESHCDDPAHSKPDNVINVDFGKPEGETGA
ncbi:MAG: hypothetical protein NVS1B14_06240 [Vulcanimicrobiaceae bacterium]